MYGVLDYCLMIARDEVRRDSYMRALRSVIDTDSVVVDLGAGIGLFAIAAAKMGARHVYAIEENHAIELGREIAKATDVADRVTFLRASAWDVELPERASILFYDMRGTLPLYSDNFQLVAHAKQSWLAPGGVHLPARDVLRAAVVSAPGCYGTIERAVRAVRELGLPEAPVRRSLMNTRMSDRDHPITPADVLTDSFAWATLEYGAVPPKSVSGSGSLAVRTPGTAQGIAVWFETELRPGIGYDTGPGREPTYSRAFLPFMEPLPLGAGDTVTVDLRALVDGTEWGWTVAVTRSDGTTTRRPKQSTLMAELRAISAIMGELPDATPARDARGERALRILGAMDGATSIAALRGAIAGPDAERVAQERALAEVISLVRRYAR